jgi:hypothetical protein
MNSEEFLNEIQQGSIIKYSNHSFINNEKINHIEFNGRALFLFTSFKLYYFKKLGNKDKYECVQIRSLENKFKRIYSSKYEIDNITEFMDTMNL